ncbi:MAG: TonB-dependent receptor [Flavobacteriales bacterium]
MLTSLTLVAFVGVGRVYAQQPTDTVRLKEVEVAATRLNTFLAGTKVQRIDSTTLARYATLDLGDLLANESPVFVKSYGLGSLATTSFRGGSANHTAILWNGFNIGSPMNGQVDLSLVPVGVANEVSIQYGGTSALWGSGAVGGTVLLNNVPQFGRGIQVDGGLTFGSFGDRRQRLRVEVPQGRSITSVAVYNADAENDFTYRTGGVERTQRNASLERRGVVVEQHLRLNADQYVSLRYWYQAADRHIPPTRLQDVSTAFQQDASHRGTLEWKRVHGRWDTQVRAAWFDERLDWHASADAASELSRSRTIIAEADVRYAPAGLHTLDLGVNNTYAQALADGYPDKPRQDRAALFASYRYRPKGGRFVGSAAARQELLDGQAVPFTGSLGGEYRLLERVILKAQMARVYRVPTFNDLYWRPGGTPTCCRRTGTAATSALYGIKPSNSCPCAARSPGSTGRWTTGSSGCPDPPTGAHATSCRSGAADGKCVRNWRGPGVPPP